MRSSEEVAFKMASLSILRTSQLSSHRLRVTVDSLWGSAGARRQGDLQQADAVPGVAAIFEEPVRDGTGRDLAAGPIDNLDGHASTLEPARPANTAE